MLERCRPAGPVETYAGAPNYTFTTIGGSTVMRLSNTLSPLERRGWSSAATFHGQAFRYEVALQYPHAGSRHEYRRLSRNLDSGCGQFQPF